MFNTGDGGQTSLSGGRRVPKTNAQIELIGSIEELIAAVGSARSFLKKEDHENRTLLLRIQDQLIAILQFFQRERKERRNLEESEITLLETKIAALSSGKKEKDPYFYPTHCHAAALTESARTVCRRAERVYAKADVSIGSKESSIHKKYLNRLGDYLQYLALDLDQKQAAAESEKYRSSAAKNAVEMNVPDLPVRTKLSREVGTMNPMSLKNVKYFMQALEDEAARRGLQLVFAVCDKAGRPVAVHVMDDAFLASYDIAVNKAYTAVALKMSTKELAALCAPGGSLYGLQQTNQGKIVIFGGGVTLRDREGNILGGLGVSGSTAEIDTMMGDVGEELFIRLQSR